MANYYVTTTGAGTNSGADWDNAFDWAAFVTHSLVSAAAGDIYWFAGGTYTLTANYGNGMDGGAQDGIKLIGVKSGTTNEPPTASDLATGTDRPLINCGGYYFFVDNYWVLHSLRFTGTNNTYTVDGDGFISGYNCYFANTNSGQHVIAVDSGFFYGCEFVNDGINCLWVDGYPAGIVNCYAHGSATRGIYTLGGSGVSIINNIISGPDTGIEIEYRAGVIIQGNTIYNCATAGIDVTGSADNIIVNNTISSCGKGIYGVSSYRQTIIDYNNYYNNTTDVDGVTKGPNAMAYNPNFTDAANGDFSLSSSSDLIGAGLGIQLGVG